MIAYSVQNAVYSIGNMLLAPTNEDSTTAIATPIIHENGGTQYVISTDVNTNITGDALTIYEGVNTFAGGATVFISRNLNGTLRGMIQITGDRPTAYYRFGNVPYDTVSNIHQVDQNSIRPDEFTGLMLERKIFITGQTHADLITSVTDPEERMVSIVRIDIMNNKLRLTSNTYEIEGEHYPNASLSDVVIRIDDVSPVEAAMINAKVDQIDSKINGAYVKS